jgi:hypothetical protein
MDHERCSFFGFAGGGRQAVQSRLALVDRVSFEVELAGKSVELVVANAIGGSAKVAAAQIYTSWANGRLSCKELAWILALDVRKLRAPSLTAGVYDTANR